VGRSEGQLAAAMSERALVKEIQAARAEVAAQMAALEQKYEGHIWDCQEWFELNAISRTLKRSEHLAREIERRGLRA